MAEPGSGFGGDSTSGSGIRAYKRAYPVVQYDLGHEGLPGRPVAAAFRGHVIDMTYLGNDAAVCIHNDEHLPPAIGCDCGFYALKARDMIETYAFAGSRRRFDGSSFVLEVALYGREVVEGPKGYRGASQQVQLITADARCLSCHSQATLFAPHGTWRSTRAHLITAVAPACEEHGAVLASLAHVGLAPLTLVELRDLLGVPIAITNITSLLWRLRNRE